MSTNIWLGNAPVVAQVATATFGVYDATTTRKITIGGVVVSALDTGGTLTAALTALAVVLNASTHPYFSAITWTSSATQITGTAKIPGVSFTFAGSVSGGTGTCTNAYTVATANQGPCDWSTASNWSTGTVPVNGDDVIIKDCKTNICFGLNQSAVTLNTLRVMQSFTGLLGMNRQVFTTSADGNTNNSNYVEYQPLYLQVGLQGTKYASVGEDYSTGTAPSGSRRIMIDFGTSQGTVDIQQTASNSSESARPAVRIKANSASLNCFVRSAQGGFGVAADQSNETSTIGKMEISDTSTNGSKVVTGPGVTMTTWEQYGGTNIMQAAATVATVNMKGGTLQTEGTFALTTVNMYSGATLNSNSTGTIGALNLYGGTANFRESNIARTVTSVVFQLQSTGSIIADGTVLTVIGFTMPQTAYQLTAK